jgi:hypothetical protein
VLLPRGREASLPRPIRAAVARLFPTIAGNPDYASIISPRHLARLRTMLQQAQTQGADVQNMDPTAQAPCPHRPPHAADGGTSRQMAPVLVFGATSGMQLMQEEIFGPILPVVSYERLDDAITHINAGPRPLALYWFGTERGVRDDVLRTHRERRRDGERHPHAHRARQPAVWRRGRQRLGGLPRRARLPALLPPEVGAGAVALGHGVAVLPALRPRFDQVKKRLRRQCRSFLFFHSLFSFGFSMSSIQVRPATLRDAKAIAQIHTVSAQEAYKGLVPDEQLKSMSVEKRQAYWREAIEYCEPQVQVAIDGEKIVGFCRLRPLAR